jgi:hypothetical protein
MWLFLIRGKGHLLGSFQTLFFVELLKILNQPSSFMALLLHYLQRQQQLWEKAFKIGFHQHLGSAMAAHPRCSGSFAKTRRNTTIGCPGY